MSNDEPNKVWSETFAQWVDEVIEPIHEGENRSLVRVSNGKLLDCPDSVLTVVAPPPPHEER